MKSSITNEVWPAYHIRNALSNGFMLWLGGVSPRYIFKAFKTTSAAAQRANKYIFDYGEKERCHMTKSPTSNELAEQPPVRESAVTWIKPMVELIWVTPEPEQVIERAGRLCHKSEERIGDNTAGPFIRKLIGWGHDSVLEHACASLRFVCDRGVSHELVRHRLASFSQESTRYCDYAGKSIALIAPPGLAGNAHLQYANMVAAHSYEALRREGHPPEITRAVLPTCLKTEIIMTTNFREWRHVFTLRCAPAAHPQMRALMSGACELLYAQAPHVFADCWDVAKAARECKDAKVQ